MARYRRKHKGKGKKQKTFHVLMLAPVVPGLKVAWDKRSDLKVAARDSIYTVSGVDVYGELPIAMDKAVHTAGLAIIGLVGHKVANKMGINRQLRRLSMGYIDL